ncbi:mip family channel protein [Stylonychia lemnae]|uniref:Mip family channel protein n=1 Tax=Stylonychia lemnae TaxID=5949 RepID=A0A078A5F0_STYLE|nr:mip family channel protein [Stylonychia lemnae]|eukprot:CDW75984.1 mip family channel protein [Stylonychia lemnae]
MDVISEKSVFYKSNVQLFFFEFLGTFLITIIINFSGYNCIIVCGGLLMCSVVTGRRTGAHLNFGVTLAIYLVDWHKNKINKKDLCNYFFSSIAGCLAAYIFTYFMDPKKIVWIVPIKFDSDPMFIFACETFFTTLFLIVVLHNRDQQLCIINDQVIGALSTMISLYFCVQCIGPITSAALGPTLPFVNILFTGYLYNTAFYLKFLPAYISSGLLSSALAALFTRFSIKYASQKSSDEILGGNENSSYQTDLFAFENNQDYYKERIPFRQIHSLNYLLPSYGALEVERDYENISSKHGKYVQFC